MVQVRLGGTLQSYSGGRSSFEIEGANIGQILAGLGEVPRGREAVDAGADDEVLDGRGEGRRHGGAPS